MNSLNKLMLHICCAPDAAVPWTELSRIEGMSMFGYFYGSHIHPLDEYEKRKDAIEILMNNVKGQCIYPAPMQCLWFESTSLLADEPEGGKRCSLCFRLQLENTARTAVDYGCSHICTTLTISPHKDVALINSIGNEIAENFGLVWIERVWRKNNGFLNSVKIAKSLGLYRQNYCGCIYSRPNCQALL
jgi:predicted adenine nucleotide alpha hydrolase (AANH) superfamily ATPase